MLNGVFTALATPFDKAGNIVMIPEIGRGKKTAGKI